MNNQDLQILVNIYNTMRTCRYTEDDIFKAAESLGALQKFIYEKNQQIQMESNKQDVMKEE